MKYEYEELFVYQGRGEKIYEFEGVNHFGFVKTLNKLGEDGWDCVGEIGGKVIMKRLIKEENI